MQNNAALVACVLLLIMWLQLFFLCILDNLVAHWKHQRTERSFPKKTIIIQIKYIMYSIPTRNKEKEKQYSLNSEQLSSN